jgi:hypothetical protein
VVLKVAEPLITHKTEAGAVAINLVAGRRGSGAGADGEIRRRLPQGRPHREVLVERMVGDVVAELIIVGIQRDPQFGLALVSVRAASWSNWSRMRRCCLPTSAEEVEAAIRRLKIAKLLAGYRGKPAADIGASGEEHHGHRRFRSKPIATRCSNSTSTR